MSEENWFDVPEGTPEFEDSRYRIILCGASAYNKKYYFNNKFDGLPQNVKEELQIICVMFTSEVGGIFTIGFTPEGRIVLDTRAAEGDLLYDDIGGGLLVKKLEQQKKEVFDAITVYYRVTFLHENPADLLENYDEDPDEEEPPRDNSGKRDEFDIWFDRSDTPESQNRRDGNS
ncbi:MAG: DUF6145 family protein [Lachnospiraceae bacterium]